jgi:GDPmannose 4,6-dehydratase
MKIVITGAAGQDGAFLVKRIINSNINASIVALSRNKTVFFERLRLIGGANLVEAFRTKGVFYTCDMTDKKQVLFQIDKDPPDVIFHLAANLDPTFKVSSASKIIFENMTGLISILEACEKSQVFPHIINAGSSLMFGSVENGVANETTSFSPITPYGIGKVAAHQFANAFRVSGKHRFSTAILFNHESILRDERWLPTKIISNALRIKNGKATQLTLGDISDGRDWCAAEDIVDGLFKIMEREAINEDFVFGSGCITSIKEILEIVFLNLGLNWEDFVISDKTLFRRNDVKGIRADITKAKKMLRWEPQISTNKWINQIFEYQSTLS